MQLDPGPGPRTAQKEPMGSSQKTVLTCDPTLTLQGSTGVTSFHGPGLGRWAGWAAPPRGDWDPKVPSPFLLQGWSC